MVKIPDLTNKQLVSQLEKYGKIMRQLVAERDKRAAAKDSDDLYTKAELAERQAAREAATPAASDGSGDNLLSFDEDELSAMEDKAQEAKAKSEEDDEEVRVTQLLQLSKEDLAALQANKKKIQKKG